MKGAEEYQRNCPICDEPLDALGFCWDCDDKTIDREMENK